MRIRSIKPEFWRSDDITGLPIATRLTFIGLWSYVDDNGVGADKIVSIVADLYADDFSRDPQETLQRVTDDLKRLSAGGQVIRYRGVHNGSAKDLLYITKWKQHQLVNHPSQGHKYPLPPDEMVEAAQSLTQPSGDPLETLPHEQGNRGAGEWEQGSEETELVAQPESAPAPPDPKPIPEAARKRGRRLPDTWRPSPTTIDWAKDKYGHMDLALELDKFTNYWHAEAGQKARKLDWDAAFRNWLYNARSPNGHRNGTTVATSDLRVAQTQALKIVPSQRLELE